MIIHNIFTGGTIGSHINNAGSISPDQNSPYKLTEMYRQFCGSKNRKHEDITFINSEPYRILSENLSAEYILKLINAVDDALKNNPDGIIVTHGTDTLQYSAAILGLIFGGSSVPIILVSSDYVLEDKRANGLINYKYAIDFITGSSAEAASRSNADYARRNKHSGVFVSYCNKGGKPTIHRATRLLPAVFFSADVRSGGDLWYGQYSVQDLTDNFIYNPLYKTAPDNYANLCEYAGISCDALDLLPLSDNILRLSSYPGIAYPKLTSAVKVVMLESYHSGTVCIDKNLKSFADNAAKLDIPIYVTGLSDEGAEYETVDMYRELGIEPIYNISPVTVYCKFWIAVSNGIDIRTIAHAHIAEDCF